MIHIVGGNGYVGSNFVVGGTCSADKFTVVDPIRPYHSHKIRHVEGTAVETSFTDCDCLVWLAGPRNSGDPREVTVSGRMIEEQFRQTLKAMPHHRLVVLFSSMSLFDNDQNVYARHKRHMEQILCDSRHESCIIRPGTIIGTAGHQSSSGTFILRKDLAVHKILRAIAEKGKPKVNGAVHRAYVTIDKVLGVLHEAIFSGRRGIVEAYDTVSGMPALFGQLQECDSEKIQLFWDNMAPSIEDHGVVTEEGLLCVQGKVAETLYLIRNGVTWV